MNMNVTTTITSKDNPVYKAALAAQRGKGRWADCLFLEGVRLCETAVSAGAPIRAVFMADEQILPGQRETVQTLLNQIEGAPVWILSGTLFQKLARTEHPQGLAMLAGRPGSNLRQLCSSGIRRGFLMAESVQDPGNLGTLIRIADAFGLDGFICDTGSADPWQDKVVRSTMGSGFHIPIFRTADAAETLAELRTAGCRIVATAPDGRPLPDIAPALNEETVLPAVLVMGNEGRGISDAVRTMADRTVAIPMAGRAESLNVAVAAGICCYAWFAEFTPGAAGR